jgi:hypothetical protein
MFAPGVNRIEMLFIVPTDAHYYKVVEKLKHLKLWHLLRHVSVHAGTIIREQSCAKLQLQMWFSIVFVGIDIISVMAAYQLCVNRTPIQQADMPP